MSFLGSLGKSIYDPREPLKWVSGAYNAAGDKASQINVDWGPLGSPDAPASADATIEAEQSPYLKELRGMLMENMQKPLGSGYEQSPLYQDMVRRSQAIMSQRGQAQGARMANQGMLSGGKVGAGRRAGTQAMKMAHDFDVQNRAAAHQEQARNQLAMINNQFKMAGFEQGLMDKDFEKQYLVMRMNEGIREADARRELDQWRAALGLIGTGAALIAAPYTGGASLAALPATTSAMRPTPGQNGLNIPEL